MKDARSGSLVVIETRKGVHACEFDRVMPMLELARRCRSEQDKCWNAESEGSDVRSMHLGHEFWLDVDDMRVAADQWPGKRRDVGRYGDDSDDASRLQCSSVR